MSFLRSIGTAFKGLLRYSTFDGVVRGTGVELWDSEHTQEVDNLRERYSALKYIEHLKCAMAGDFSGRAEWSRFINSLPEDERLRFNGEVDSLIEEGLLVHVLTTEQMAEVRQAVLDKADEYRAQGSGLMKDWGVDPAVMHGLVSGTRAAEEGEGRPGAFVLNPYPDAAIDEDDIELEAWAEGDEGNGS